MWKIYIIVQNIHIRKNLLKVQFGHYEGYGGILKNNPGKFSLFSLICDTVIIVSSPSFHARKHSLIFFCYLQRFLTKKNSFYLFISNFHHSKCSESWIKRSKTGKIKICWFFAWLYFHKNNTFSSVRLIHQIYN